MAKITQNLIRQAPVENAQNEIYEPIRVKKMSNFY